MSDAPFDPTGAVTFDLAAGRVSMKGSPARVLVPSEQLSALCDAAGQDATRSLGRTMGEAMARRALEALAGPDGSVGGVSIESFVQHLAGEFALVGLGAVGMERWGRAMLLTVASPVAHDGLLRAVLEGALESTTKRTVRCTKLMQADGLSRFLIASPSTAEQVERQLGGGKAWAEILVELHGAGSAAQRGGEA